MSGIDVTIYNDDEEFGRDIQVVQLDTLSGKRVLHKIQKPKENDDSKCVSYELSKGEMLIITPTGK